MYVMTHFYTIYYDSTVPLITLHQHYNDDESCMWNYILFYCIIFYEM